MKDTTININEELDTVVGQPDDIIKNKVQSIYFASKKKQVEFTGEKITRSVSETNISYTVFKPADDKFKQFIGRVIKLEREGFTAIIESIKKDAGEMLVKFNFHKKVSIINKEFLCEGAVFYWTVGIFRNPITKSYQKKSEIEFKRPIKINLVTIDELAEKKALELLDGIKWLE